MPYLVIGHDGKDPEAPARRMKARPDHIALGDKMKASGELLYAVALLNDAEQMVGSVMIYDFKSKSDLDAWMKVEPYLTGKVWEKIEVKPCRVGPSFAKK